eukprot:GILJ01010838.1.p1 GENE.GILJ01010838.1~~GILJ01010838.1.p1  ORF type:complete len:446 (-),score=46.89 GILJ01010838.1:200-1480(-)
MEVEGLNEREVELSSLLDSQSSGDELMKALSEYPDEMRVVFLKRVDWFTAMANDRFKMKVRNAFQHAYGFYMPEELFEFWTFLKAAGFGLVSSAVQLWFGGILEVMDATAEDIAGLDEDDRQFVRRSAVDLRLHQRLREDFPEMIHLLKGLDVPIDFYLWLDDYRTGSPSYVQNWHTTWGVGLQTLETWGTGNIFQELRAWLEDNVDGAESNDVVTVRSSDTLRSWLMHFATDDRKETKSGYLTRYIPEGRVQFFQFLISLAPQTPPISSEESTQMVALADYALSVYVPWAWQKLLWKFIPAWKPNVQTLTEKADSLLLQDKSHLLILAGRYIWHQYGDYSQPCEAALFLFRKGYAAQEKQDLYEVVKLHHEAQYRYAGSNLLSSVSMYEYVQPLEASGGSFPLQHDSNVKVVPLFGAHDSDSDEG